mgnify:CR=1 FL=1
MLLITTSSLCGLGFYGYEQSRKRLAAELTSETVLMANRLKLNLPPAIWNIDDEYIESVLSSEVKAKFIDGIYITDEKDRFIKGITKKDNEITLIEEMPKGVGDLYESKLTYSEPDSDEVYTVGNIALNVTDKADVAFLKAEIKRIAIQIVSLNIILLVLFSIAIKRISTPLATLKDIAANIALGNYDLDINIKRKDEIGELATSFTTMKEGIKKKVQDLRDLNVISEDLAVCTSQTTALEKTLHALSIHSKVKFGSVYLYNNEDKLELKTFYPPKQIQENQKPRQFVDGEGIIGITCQKKEIIYIEDTSQDERFVGKDEEQPKSIICVPLMDNNMALGVLNLSGSMGEVKFEETDYEFAETIARQLVTTIKNIRMRETIEEQNRNLEAKVAERTAALRQKNHDIASMMENMHQGLFTITAGGLIHSEYAAYLEEIFETDRIADRNFADLLFNSTSAGSDAVDQNITAVDAIVGEDEMMYGFNSHCLLEEMVISFKDGREKILELDWDPIVSEEGEVDKLMVTVRDVTELKALEAESQEQKEELEIIGEVLSVDAAKFKDFIDTSHEFLAECLTIIETTSKKDANAIANLFRSMHTVKGNARTYGLKYITDVVHDVESTYDELRKNEEAAWDAPLLLEELDGAKRIVGRYAHVFREKLGLDKTAANETSLDQQRVATWLSRIDELTKDGKDSDLKDVVSEAYNLLVSTEAKPIKEVISDVIQSANSLADQLNKAQPEVTITDNGILINREADSTLNNIFMHVFRNAMDHGIEGTKERLTQGKTEQGNILLDVSVEDNSYANLSIQDDGRGLALNKIYEMALGKGIYEKGAAKPSDQDIANLIFSSGFSTSDEVTDVSGRGVGMDAVKGFLEKEGGSIEVMLTGGQEGDSFRGFSTNIRIPKKFYKLAIDLNKDAA